MSKVTKKVLQEREAKQEYFDIDTFAALYYPSLDNRSSIGMNVVHNADLKATYKMTRKASRATKF